MATNPLPPPTGQEIINIDSDSPASSSVDSTIDSPRSVAFLWDLHPPPMQNELPVHGPRLPSTPPQKTSNGNYEGCLLAITAVFPDISHEHVEQLWNKTERASFIETDILYQHLIEKILDGGRYPKERDRLKELKKRKRASPEVEAAKWKYADLRHDPEEYARVAKARLSERFDMVPTKFIHDTFKEHSHFYGAFFAIDEAERTRDDTTGQPFQKLKSRRVSNMRSEQVMASLEAQGYSFAGLREEMRAAEARWQKADDARNFTKQRVRAKMASDEVYRRNGETMECACCFSDDNPPTDMTHCNGNIPHFFCFACARRNAETDMTSLKYALHCMDQSRCEASFSRDEKARFLDAAAIEKLERLQQQDEIRRAEMGDLEACPFCDYVAICPPAEINRVFECQNPECLEISCRLCKEKAHIPLSCEEFKKENGIGERHAIEEARTNALVRSCKKCNVRILKEDGCNKVICTNCYSVLCDYCGEDISKTKYDHFDSSSGVGRPVKGKCPLYDPSERKNEQIERAGKAAMEKVRAENPNLSEDDLKIKFAKTVEDDTKRHSDMSDEGLRRLEQRHLARRAQLNHRQENIAHHAHGGRDEVHRMQEALQQHLRRHDLQRQELDLLRARNATQRGEQLRRAADQVQAIHERRQRAPPYLPDIELARLRAKNFQDQVQGFERHLANAPLNQARYGVFAPVPDNPIQPHTSLYDFGRPMGALPGNRGSVDQQRDRIARDFPPGDLGHGPLTTPHINFGGPARPDEWRQGAPPNESNPDGRLALPPQTLAELDRSGGTLGTRAHDHHRRNKMPAADHFDWHFANNRPRRERGPGQNAMRPGGIEERIADAAPVQTPARRPFQPPGHVQDLEHFNPKDLTKQKPSVCQDLGTNARGFNIPDFHDPLGRGAPRYPTPPPYPPHFGHAIETPIDLEANPADWRDPLHFWNADRHLPDSVNEPGSILDPRRRNGMEAFEEFADILGGPQARHGRY